MNPSSLDYTIDISNSVGSKLKSPSCEMYSFPAPPRAPPHLVKRVLPTIQMPKSETWDIKIYEYQALFKGERYYLVELSIYITRKLNSTVGEQIAYLGFLM